MKRALFTLLFTTASCGATPQTGFDGQAALQYAQAQVDFGARVPNTEGHRRTGDWLLEQLRARADTVEVQAFTHVTTHGDTLALRNFVAGFRPEATERVLFLAHWDTRPRADNSPNMADRQRPVIGANDGASGVALLLGVADVLRAHPPSVGVDLLFVDGEDYGDFSLNQDVLIGSTYYAQHLDPQRPKPLYAVLWDMIGDRDLRIPPEGNSVDRAPEVVQRVWRVARDLGYGAVFVERGGNYVTDDHVPLLDAGIRAIDVIDLQYPPHHTTQDTMDKISAESLQIVGDVAVTLVK